MFLLAERTLPLLVMQPILPPGDVALPHGIPFNTSMRPSPAASELTPSLPVRSDSNKRSAHCATSSSGRCLACARR